MKNPPARLTEIDLLRFVAALLAVLFHYTFRGTNGDENLTSVSFPILAKFFQYGYLGVHLFFLISGFVILMTAWNKSPKDFVISRIARLYPAYWVCGTATYVAIVLWGGDYLQTTLSRYIANLSMFQGFFGIKNIDGVYWTLYLEIKFYFLIFWLCYFKQFKHSRIYLGLWIILLFILLEFPNRLVGTLFLAEYGSYFAGGAIFYLIYREGIDFYKLVLLAGSLALSMMHEVRAAVAATIMFDTEYSRTVVVSAVIFLYSIFFLIATHRTARFRSDKLIVLGAMTYPLYLMHQNIGYIIFNAMHGQIDRHLILIGTMAFMLVLSYWVNVHIEKKFAHPFERFLENVFHLLDKKTDSSDKLK